MASRFARAAARANGVMMDRLSDGTCTYHPAQGGDVTSIPYQLNLSYETFDAQGFSVRVPALTLPKDRVGDVDRADEFTLNDRRWRFNNLLEDDGAFVTIEVT